MPYKVAAFYQFVALPDFENLREPLRNMCVALDIRGIILLAAEGINGTVAGGDAAIDARAGAAHATGASTEDTPSTRAASSPHVQAGGFSGVRDALAQPYPARVAHITAPAYAEHQWLEREERDRTHGTADEHALMLDWQAPA